MANAAVGRTSRRQWLVGGEWVPKAARGLPQMLSAYMYVHTCILSTKKHDGLNVRSTYNPTSQSVSDRQRSKKLHNNQPYVGVLSHLPRRYTSSDGLFRG
jgi:hypothetical protein